jgi:hypothetical protein
MVLLCAPMFMLDPMAVLRAQVLLPLSLRMMLSMPFNNSMGTIGKVAPLKFAKIDSLAQPDLVVAVDLAVVEGLAVALERVEVALVLAEGLAVDLGVVVAATVVVALEAGPLVALTEELVLLLQHQIHLLTSLLLAQKEARPSMSAM